MQGAKVIIQRNVKHIRTLCRSFVSSEAVQPAVEKALPGKNPDVQVIGQRLEETITSLATNSEKLNAPVPDGEPKPLSPKIAMLVDEISRLNLLEVAELSAGLKKRLNLPDAPMMPMGGFFAAGGAPAEEEEEVQQTAQQTSFTVKLMGYEEKQKVALIKELKNLMEGMNLVQAKKFVEGAPQVVKADIGKDEAEKLKEALSKVGAQVEIS